MTAPSRPDAERPGLNRDRVVDTALAIVDRDGLDGLTMRRLASELGVEAMSLYHWFPNKAAILDALVEAAIRETATRVDATPEAGWRANLRALAMGYRQVLLAHPNTVSCMGGRPGKSVETMRFIERMLDVLRSDGFSPVHAVRSMQSVLAYINGAVSAEIGRDEPRGRVGRLPRAVPAGRVPPRPRGGRHLQRTAADERRAVHLRPRCPARRARPAAGRRRLSPGGSSVAPRGFWRGLVAWVRRSRARCSGGRPSPGDLARPGRVGATIPRQMPRGAAAEGGAVGAGQPLPTNRRAMTLRQSVSSAPSKIDSTRASTNSRLTGYSSAYP